MYSLFFFFKQKTAYEVRISDWSSDVCSSDLILGNDPVPVTGILSENVELAEATYDLHGNFAVLALAAMEEAAELVIPVMTIADGSQTLEKIGSASCRERVCQYVSISGVAVSLKKKIHM